MQVAFCRISHAACFRPRYADLVVINISSPNTPGLRALQSRKELEDLVRAVKESRDKMTWGLAGPPPLVVKIAPDLQVSPAPRVLRSFEA